MLDQTSGPVCGPTKLYYLVLLEAKGQRKWPSEPDHLTEGVKGPLPGAPIVFLQLIL